ncbi:restriction endonuclease subunit S [Latilactobacillus sakei]|uniref:restriction endonuclease subunit S n=1 Tax=Latilactobacillus sakei TaxID=1599 RepID=UPI00232F54EF|nr:restriction endonuclease subunit S [Latilactobacillus sakei]MDB1553829.1 restriction endonuclease subunit S [Latilactobacillus sakei]
MSNKVPQIRFNGYSDAWEERKFKNFISKSGRRNKTGELTEAYSVSNTLGLVKQSDQFNGSRLDSLDKKDYKIVQPNEFAYNPARINVGSIAFNNLDKPVIVSSLYVIVNMSDTLNNQFILHWLKSPAFNYEVIRNTEGSVREYLFYENFSNVSFPYTPNYDEQIKIGQFFNQLDNTIALHQRKLDLLKEQKKGYLQKMFPKNGAKVPELRFAGFADDWEQRKLGDLLKEFSIKSKIEDEHKVLSSTNSGMEFREGRVSGTSNLGYKIIKNGDLVLSPQNLWLGNININNIGKGLVSPSYKTFELINIDSSFINPQLRTQKMLEEYKNSSTQGASVVRRNLEIDSFYQIKIFVPTISEQEKIGSFFQQLDNTIVLHQRKLDLLKEQKKGFLQKMFV